MRDIRAFHPTCIVALKYEGADLTHVKVWTGTEYSVDPCDVKIYTVHADGLKAITIAPALGGYTVRRVVLEALRVLTVHSPTTFHE